VNGREVKVNPVQGFLNISRRWTKGDRVEVSFPMPVRRVLANEKVTDDAGKAAVERGPLVYAFEAADNGPAVTTLRIPLDTELTHTYRADLLKGLEVITAESGDKRITAIPYFAWANRGRGEMRVWIPY
jgi:DUF1680 family protein